MQVAPLPSRDAAPAASSSETVWLEFRDRLRAFVARRIRDHADVDDIVQRVFLRMHASLGEIRNGERIHAWLYTTARRAVTDYYRSRARRARIAGEDAVDLDTLPHADVGPAEGDAAAREVAACLAPVVTRLAPADRDAITMTEIQGLRLADAALRAGLSLSGMKSRVQRARRRLKAAMLECCHIALDGRGAPIACSQRDATGPCCGAAAGRE
jgi:RNA polymerase sigma-70 factor, ECF subfamily